MPWRARRGLHFGDFGLVPVVAKRELNGAIIAEIVAIGGDGIEAAGLAVDAVHEEARGGDAA